MTTQAQKNEETARKNLARQGGAKHDPKFGEPGYVYNDEGAKIENPGPTEGPYYADDKPIGYAQLGDRVLNKPAPETINQPTGDEENRADTGPLTPSEPGSAGVQKVETTDTSKPASKKKA